MIISLDCIAWIACGVICLLFELMFSGLFFCLSLALGTLPAGVCAWYGGDLLTQMMLFIGCSLFSFFVLYSRMGMKAYTQDNYRSAVDALPGKTGIVVQKIGSACLGQVYVGGQIWSAQSIDSEEIDEGSAIRVIRVEGVRLIVKSI